MKEGGETPRGETRPVKCSKRVIVHSQLFRIIIPFPDQYTALYSRCTGVEWPSLEYRYTALYRFSMGSPIYNLVQKKNQAMEYRTGIFKQTRPRRLDANKMCNQPSELKVSLAHNYSQAWWFYLVCSSWCSRGSATFLGKSLPKQSFYILDTVIYTTRRISSQYYDPPVEKGVDYCQAQKILSVPIPISEEIIMTN